MRYTRPLSPFERMWLAAQTSCGITMVEGRGELALDALRQAVRQASLANPGSRLHLHGVGPWAHWRETSVFPEVSEIAAAGWDGDGDRGAPFSDQAHMDPFRGPSVSLLLVHGCQVKWLVQRTHHATMDGIGAMQFLEDVFRALRGETPLGACSAATDLDIARALGGRRRHLTTRCLKPFSGTSSGIGGSTWERVRRAGPLRRKPLARAIHTIAAIARRHASGDVLIDIPVNLRTPELRNTGNLTGSLRLNVASHANLEDIAREISQQVALGRHADAVTSSAGVRHVPLAVVRGIARHLARRAVRTERFSPTAVVSNLGNVPLERLSAPQFQAQSAIIVPPAYDGVPLFLVISGNGYGIDLAARAPVALAADGRLRLLLEEIADALVDRESVRRLA